jgi:uncharacterized protein YndB with AHSA1/START domain
MDETLETDRRHTAFRLIKATTDVIYDAFVRPENLVLWLPPDGARGEIEHFDPLQGGRFRIILTFSAAAGKSSRHSDVVEGRFLQLLPGKRIVQEVQFASDRPEFAGTMTMDWSLSPATGGTIVTIIAVDVPVGISRADHERGMASTLDNLARFVEYPKKDE